MIVAMVREGFDRRDLYEMPHIELLDWYEVFQKQMKAEAEAIKKARENAKRKK